MIRSLRRALWFPQLCVLAAAGVLLAGCSSREAVVTEPDDAAATPRAVETRGVEPGDEVEVTLQSGPTVAGWFVAVDGDSLRLELDVYEGRHHEARPLAIPLDDVAEITKVNLNVAGSVMGGTAIVLLIVAVVIAVALALDPIEWGSD
jgi:hypothetical protein